MDSVRGKYSSVSVMNNDFPYLNSTQRFQFPPVEDSTPEGVVAVGGNLSPGMLLSAYEQGIFPWFNEKEPLLWWSPDPRFLLFPGEIHVSRSMGKLLKKNKFTITLNHDFSGVIESCASVVRSGQPGTWITHEMKEAYTELWSMGYAHSVEAWFEGQLVGGIYGIHLGNIFFGESMFSFHRDASKAAFITFAHSFFSKGGSFIDCQVYTKHLESLGAKSVSREYFLQLLKKGLKDAMPDDSFVSKKIPPISNF